MIRPPFGGVPSALNPDHVTGAGYTGSFTHDHDRLFFAPEGMEMFNKDGSSVEMIGTERSPGMEMHNGTLGIGLSTAAGLACARKQRGEAGEVCIFMSDGEVQEGQTWEAVQAAAHHKIGNLWALMDVNRQQCDGARDNVVRVGDRATKLRIFGAVVAEVDAHDLDALRQAKALPRAGKPLIILANSSPTRGMNYLMRRVPRLHYVGFKSEAERDEMKLAIAVELGMNPVMLTEAALSTARVDAVHSAAKAEAL